MSRNLFTEALESRTLMSATVLNTAVRNDQLKVDVDLLKFRADCFYSASTMLGDLLAIKVAAAGKIPAIAPAVKQYRYDLNHMHGQLLADRLTQAANVDADESVIALARLKCLKAIGTSAETADRATLLADRIQLQNDIITGLNTRLATRQAFETTIAMDGQAVINAVQTDTNPTVVADVTKYINDKNTFIATLSGDLTTLIADRTQLVTDLTAEQTAL